ncbi:hypothetical protein [Actinophytocola algeriensis]|uniref:Uncharacterized protein n=1 Tax=Actinophytocola algeriensis TaxID=1768010 RepID=A0A7W7Q1E9_9PSEU|nr:hypothetical protein [Actinophytocola algeriensis]MBB4905044.1 hypothetical protein [Actinophytocola algeriensis]MBE1476096.1 hypothetical protein [Actinophytocola algeriensis]
MAHEFPLAPYDIDLDDYAAKSWLSFSRGSGADLALVRLVTHDSPFDTVEGVEVDPATFARGQRFEVPLGDTTFAYVRRTPGETVRVDRIAAVE